MACSAVVLQRQENPFESNIVDCPVHLVIRICYTRLRRPGFQPSLSLLQPTASETSWL